MTIDIAAIRRRVNRSTGGIWTLRERRSLDRRVLAVVSEGEGEMTYADIAEVPLEPGDDINDWRNDAEFIASARTDIPALLAELDRVRAELAKARRERDEYAADNTRVAVSLVDVQRQLTAANHHTDGLAADVRAYANEVAAKDDLTERLAGALADALSRFTEPGYPNEPVRRTGWVGEESLAAWRSAYAEWASQHEPTTTDAEVAR